MSLPSRTVERLSKYRRLLEKEYKGDHAYFFSHHLAKLLHLTPVQVRRDLMLIGMSGNHRKGYNAKELIELVGKTIDGNRGQRLAIVGMGNLGCAVARFIRKNASRMEMVAGFDIDPEKTGKEIEGVTCYPIDRIDDLVARMQIDIMVLTTSAASAQEITHQVVSHGVKGILNFTSAQLNVPSDVYLKDYDILTSLEEIGFFIQYPVPMPNR